MGVKLGFTWKLNEEWDEPNKWSLRGLMMTWSKGKALENEQEVCAHDSTLSSKL